MDVLDAIKGRRSINLFEQEAVVSDDQLKELIGLANLAPSSMNLQPWRVIAVRSPERKKVLRGIANNQPKIEEAPAVLIIIADPHAMEANMEAVLSIWVELGYMKEEMKAGYARSAMKLYDQPDSEKRKIFAVKNTGFFAMNLMVAARGLGLETHPMDGFDEEKLKKEFNIPDHCVVPLLIAVGNLRKGVTLLPRAFRRPVEDFVTFE